MFAKTQTETHIQMEIVKWFVLVILAGAIALLLTGKVGGRDLPKPDAKPPAYLPAEIEKLAVPMPMAEPSQRSMDEGLLDELPMDELSAPMNGDPFWVASEVWNAIDLHTAGRVDEAIEAWKRVQLPESTDIWRQIALGYAHLQLAEYDQAAEVLAEAKYAAPDHPVVHFVIGTLWLAKAETAHEWIDIPGFDPTRLAVCRLAVWTPIDVAPNTKSMYRLAAIMSFEKAARLAGKVNLDEPLLTGEWLIPRSDELVMPMTTPTVRDLLSAFDADRFESRSHVALGVLHMERDVLDHAEKHLDQGAALGEPTGPEFRELGERLERRGQFGDAMRVFLKSMSHGGGADTVGKVLENAGKAILQ